MNIVNATRSQTIASLVTRAASPEERRRGLLGKKRMQPGEAMVFPRCRQVHTIGMRFPIDILFLDRAGSILRLCKGLGPWRISPLVSRARTVVELPMGTLDETGTEIGDRILIG